MHISVDSLNIILVLHYFRDEKSAGSSNDLIGRLFDHAVRDFHSPEVYVEYVQWACGTSLNFAREVTVSPNTFLMNLNLGK